MRGWRWWVGLGVLAVAVVAVRRRAAANEEDPAAQDLRAVIRDARGYLRRLHWISPRVAAEARREIANGERNLAAERAAWWQLGLPVTMDEVRDPMPPPHQDAAPLYRELMQVLNERPLASQLRELVWEAYKGAALSEDAVAKLRQLLRERQDVLTLIHQATDRPKCTLQGNWESQLVAFDYGATTSALGLLRAESRLLARDGEVTAAIANQARVLRVAEHVGAEPLLINYLLSAAWYLRGLEGLEELLHVAGDDADAADAVRAAITTYRPPLDLRRSLVGESVFLTFAMDHSRREVRETGPTAFRSNLLWTLDDALHPTPTKAKPLSANDLALWDGILDAVEARGLGLYRRMVAVADRPHPERQAFLAGIDRALDARSRNPVHLWRATAMRFSGLEWKRARARAYEAVLIASAAVLAYRSRQGRLPKTLDEALPEPPSDPFTGAPLRYHHDKETFRIESAGRQDRRFMSDADPNAPVAVFAPDRSRRR